MGTRRIKVKRWKVDAAGKMVEEIPVLDSFSEFGKDHPLLGGPATFSNATAQTRAWPNNQSLALQAIQDMIAKFNQMMAGLPTNLITLMSEKIELYNNVIESKYGVKLCISQNHDSDMTSMLLLVPNLLFADDKGRELLADALQNIAQFILSLE